MEPFILKEFDLYEANLAENRKNQICTASSPIRGAL